MANYRDYVAAHLTLPYTRTGCQSIFLKRRPIVCKIRNNKLCKEIVHSDDLLYLSAVLSLMETIGGNKRQMGFLLW